MQKKINVFLVAFLLLFSLFSCDSKSVYDQYQSLPNRWNKDAEISFQFEAPDTTTNYNLFVNIRNNKAYKYNNLFLITKLENPNGKTFIDTLEYKMAAPNGELLGSGFSDVKENKLWYKGHNGSFKFSENGTYNFKIQQAMRAFGKVTGIENLEGITEVGFRIEKR